MNRCKKSSRTALLCAALLAPGFAAAQGLQRNFPDDAKRGVLVVTTPPNVQLDGRADRLAPGARIYGPDNLLVLSGTLVGQQLLVNYTRSPQGQLQQVWLLTPLEARERRASASTGNSLFTLPAWLEGPKPATDDGRTPYKDLPSYPGPQ